MTLADRPVSYRQLLALRSFRLIWFGQCVSRLGDGMFVVGLAFLLLGGDSATQRASGAATYAALLACNGVAALAALLPGGVVADALPRRLTLVVADVLRALAVLGLMASAGPSHGPVQYLFAIALGLGGGFFGPAYTAIIPDIVPPSHLQTASSLTGVSTQLVRICGALAGAGLAVLLGPRMTIAVDALTFLVAALATATAHVKRPARVSRTAIGLNFLTEGLREAVGVPWLGAMLLQGFFQVALVLGPLQVLTPLLLGERGQNALYGPLLACQAAGSLGAAALARLRYVRRPGLMVNLCLLLVATEPAVLLLHGGSVVLGSAFIAKGFALGTYSTYFYVALQSRVRPAVRSRVAALNQVSEMAGQPLSNLFAVPLVVAVGSAAVLAGCTAATVLTAVAVLTVSGVLTFGAPSDDSLRKDDLKTGAVGRLGR